MNIIHQQSPFRWWTGSRSPCSHFILGWILSSLLSHLSPWCLAEDSFLLKAVVGEAKIYNGDVSAAQLRAERVALNRAVEQALGLNLQRRRLSEEGILLRDILHANSNGYAQVIRRGRRWREQDTAFVIVDVAVADQPLAQLDVQVPFNSNLMIQIEEIIINDSRQRPTPLLLRDGLARKLEQHLADIGYTVWQSDSHSDLLSPADQTDLWPISQRQLTSIMVLGRMELEIGDSTAYPAGVQVVATTQLEAVRLDPQTERMQRYSLPPLVVSQTFRRQWVMGRVVAETFQRVLAENLVGQLLKWSGSPARSVLVYVQNLPDLFSYQALQDRLRQDTVLVEKVQGIRYHPDLSRLDLVLTEQNWQQESVAEQIEYLAASIEAAGRYQVLAKGQRSLSIRCLR